jgi:hypothetical protein
MSLPTEFDFALIKIGNDATPEVFAISCGKQDLTFNITANATDRFVRDCAKPGEIPFRKDKVTGKQMDITAAGLTDAATYGAEFDMVGAIKSIKVELYTDDGTDTGDLLGTVGGEFRVRSLNVSAPREGDSSVEMTLASFGEYTWTAAS